MSRAFRMKLSRILSVRVSSVESLTPLIKRFTLVPVAGDALPGFSAGSHVLVTMPYAGRTYRNAYSLLGTPGTRSYYQIAVRRQEHSRGGSTYLHDHVNVGDVLQINPPANLFSLDRLATKHLLIAGGIGITPFMSYIKALAAQFTPYELHYAYREPLHAAFRAQLARHLGSQLHEYDSACGHRLLPRPLLSAQPLGTHVYVCGPQSLLEAVVGSARESGWADSHIHYEKFSAPQTGRPFKVSCARSNSEIEVSGDISLLEALEAAGIEVPSMCRGGACGKCETGLLEGVAEHRDSYLSEALRDCRIMPCVSRANGERLVLDL